MTIKKLFSSIFLKAAILLVLGLHVRNNLPSFQERILRSEFPFCSPYMATADSRRNIYLVDNRSRRITKMTKDGEVIFMLKGGDRNPNRFYRVSNIAVDTRDRLYVLNNIDNLDDGYVERYTLLRFLPDGRLDKVIASFSRTKEQRLGEDRLIVSNIVVQKGGIFFFETRNNAGTVLRRLDMETGAVEDRLTVPQQCRTINFSALREGACYLTLLDGRVYRAFPDGKIESLPKPDLRPDAICFPWDVETDAAGTLFFSDIARGCITRVVKGGEQEIFFPRAGSGAADVPGSIVSKSICANEDGFLVCIDEQDDTVYGINPDGSVMFRLRNGILPPSIMFFRLAVWMEIVLFIIVALFFIKDIFVKVMRRKIPLIVKQLFIFIPGLILSVGYVSYEIFHNLYAENEKSMGHEVAMYSQIASRLIDGDAVARITRPEHYGNEDYRKIEAQMRSILNDNRDPWNALPYTRIIKFYGGKPYIIADWSGYVGTYYPFLKAQPMHYRAFEKGEIGYGRYDDIDVGLFAGVAPVRDSKGEIVGVYELMVDDSILDELIHIFARHVTKGIAVSILFFACLVSLITMLILASIRKLRHAVAKMARGEFSTSVTIRTKDEVEDLGRGFNTMSKYIRDYIDEITSLNRAYVRFVPREFLHYLEKQSIAHMRLGDQVHKEMTILFSDIRSFTSLSEKMSPEENFSFINSYLKEMGPVIRNSGGFIDKYIGDAIMALFPEKADDALRAARDMRVRLEAFNAHRLRDGRDPIDIGTGIHTGNLMLGIVGEEERMEGTVISDSVNIASRIEGLTKVYGASIIVSEQTLKQIDAPEQYGYRFLDKVKVTGKQKAVMVFEVFGSDPEPMRALKAQTKAEFENGTGLYFGGKPAEALKIFRKIAAANGDDKAVKLYIARCEDFIKLGIPHDGVGIETVNVKK